MKTTLETLFKILAKNSKTQETTATNTQRKELLVCLQEISRMRSNTLRMEGNTTRFPATSMDNSPWLLMSITIPSKSRSKQSLITTLMLKTLQSFGELLSLLFTSLATEMTEITLLFNQLKSQPTQSLWDLVSKVVSLSAKTVLSSTTSTLTTCATCKSTTVVPWTVVSLSITLNLFSSNTTISLVKKSPTLSLWQTQVKF